MFRQRASRARADEFDRLGGVPDGGLAIVLPDGEVLHEAPARVVASLRYVAASAQTSEDGLPSRLAVTASLRGEGTTFVARTLASVIAYDTDHSVALVDLNWTEPGSDDPQHRPRVASTDEAAEDAPQAATELPNESDTDDPATRPVKTVKTGPNKAVPPSRRTGGQASGARRRGSRPPSRRPAAPVVEPEHDAAEVLDSDGSDSTDGASDRDDADPVGRPTIIDAVELGVAVDDIVQPTINPRLALVTAGPLAVSRRPAMAGSRALEDVIEALAKRFDHLVLDIPAVLGSTDALRLVQLADVYALVIRQGVTATRQVEAALEGLRGSEPLGVILNQYTSRVPRRLRRMVGA